MGGQNTTTSTNTSSSALTDPVAKGTLDQLLTGLGSTYSAGPTYVGPGATTKAGQTAALDAAGNPAFGAGLNSAYSNVNSLLNSGGLSAGQQGDMGDLSALAKQYGQMANDPASTQAGQNLINDTLRSTNAAFNNSGLFGSDNNQTAAARGVSQGLGELQQNYLGNEGATLSNLFGMGQQGVNNQSSLSQLLPSLYQAGQMPSGTQQAVGSAQDIAAQNAANKNITLLQNLVPLLTGAAPLSGQQSVSSTTTPAPNPWLGLLGLGLGAL